MMMTRMILLMIQVEEYEDARDVSGHRDCSTQPCQVGLPSPFLSSSSSLPSSPLPSSSLPSSSLPSSSLPSSSLPSSSPCSSPPSSFSQGGGTCEAHDGTFTCYCTEGRGGRLCQNRWLAFFSLLL